MDPLGPYGYVYGEIVPAELEKFEIHYQDPKAGSKMSFERKNYFMFVNKLPPGSPPSFIISHIANEIHNFPYTKYTP